MVNHLELSQKLGQWFQGSLGAEVAATEQAELSKVLPDFYGYHLLQLGEIQQANWLDASPIQHRISLDQSNHTDTPLSQVLGSYQDLPFATDSLDVVLIPHVLEFQQQPQEILQEAWRTLIAEGHIIIFCFNSMSLWGLWRSIQQNKRLELPWAGNFLTARKIRHWLEALGCELVVSKTLFFRPPISHLEVRNNMNFMEKLGSLVWPALGGINFLVAKKKIITLTPVKPLWRDSEVVVEKGLEPTMRGLKLEVHSDKIS